MMCDVCWTTQQPKTMVAWNYLWKSGRKSSALDTFLTRKFNRKPESQQSRNGIQIFFPLSKKTTKRAGRTHIFIQKSMIADHPIKHMETHMKDKGKHMKEKCSRIDPNDNKSIHSKVKHNSKTPHNGYGPVHLKNC